MGKNRMEAFSDGVIAIIITIMVLELKAPEGAGLSALRPLLPVFLSYVLSFAYVGIYWNNHHHLLYTVRHVSGPMLWANLHLLFWLSLTPATTAWVGRHHPEPVVAALYGANLLMYAVSYSILTITIIRHHGRQSDLARAIGRDWKGKLSLVFYVAAVPLAWVSPWISYAMYSLVALIWFAPDRRIERILAAHAAERGAAR